MRPCRLVSVILIALAFFLAALWAVYYDAHAPGRKPQPYPVELPTPRIKAQIYQLYLPLLIRPRGLFGNGVAGVPVVALRSDWFYVYGHCASPCVSLNKGFVAQDWCEPYELLFNEPELFDWQFGGTMPVDRAVTISKGIRVQCPDSWLVAGNVSHLPQGIAWLASYVSLGGEYDALGYHAYGDANFLAQQTDAMRYTFPDASLCLTEWNTYAPNDDPVEFQKMLDYIQANLTCSAVFMANWSQEGYWTNFDLQTVGGALTPKGQVFAERTRGGIP